MTALAGQIPKAGESVGRAREVRYFVLRSRKILISTAIIAAFLVLAALGPMIRPGDP